MTDLRAIAFYLPQFHPIVENDEWWGKGFTEWTNVTKAKPLFPGHYQPHLPADLGFYDLRLPEVRQAQADLAREHGISGFCYYHYWFNGRRVLDRPFDAVLRSGEPDFPFCLCWANENWTRRWDGADTEKLLEQAYSAEDDRQHIRWLCTAFRDSRYIRIDDRPLILIYRVSHLPNPSETAEIWREEARRSGIGEIFLCAVESFPSEFGLGAKSGFDGAVEFAPDWSFLPPAMRTNKAWRISQKLGLSSRAFRRNYIAPYRGLRDGMLRKEEGSTLRFPCVTPSWDNTPRRRTGATILLDSTPEAYGEWLSQIVRRTRKRPPRDQIIFLNAWNEWAEGNHLEPCQKWGRKYLEATKRALAESA